MSIGEDKLKKSSKPLALLIVPPVYDFALYDLYFKPFGLLRIGRWLEKAGWNCIFVNSLAVPGFQSSGRLKRKPDGTGKFLRTPAAFPGTAGKPDRQFSRYGISREALEAEIAALSRADMIFIAGFMTYWYMGIKETAEICRKLLPGAEIAAGGVYPTLLPAHCRENAEIDYLIEGEAWASLNSIFRKKNLPEGDPGGCSFVMDNPVWSDAGVIRINQGCPMKCRYCASGKIAAFKPGDPETAFSQVKMLHKAYGTGSFAFYDDALLYKKEQIFLPFLEKVIEYGADLNFYVPNGLHIDYLDNETVKLMKKAGFREIRLGFESSNPGFHSEYGSKFKNNEFPGIIDMLKKNSFSGNEIIVYLLAGLPEQEAAEVEESVRYLLQHDVKISISEYSPVPGSLLWEKSIEKSIYPLKEEPLYHNNSVFPMQWEKFTPADMAAIKKLSQNA